MANSTPVKAPGLDAVSVSVPLNRIKRGTAPCSAGAVVAGVCGCVCAINGERVSRWAKQIDAQMVRIHITQKPPQLEPEYLFGFKLLGSICQVTKFVYRTKGQSWLYTKCWDSNENTCQRSPLSSTLSGRTVSPRNSEMACVQNR